MVRTECLGQFLYVVRVLHTEGGRSNTGRAIADSIEPSKTSHTSKIELGVYRTFDSFTLVRLD